MNTTAYLINTGLSASLEFKLRTFGCTTYAYVHVDPENRDELDANIVKCYFIGYVSNMFGYRFIDNKNKKIIRHCDVKIDKNVLYRIKRRKIPRLWKQVRQEGELQKLKKLMRLLLTN